MGRYKYPKVVSWLSVHGHHNVRNHVTGYEYELNPRQLFFLQRLNGKRNPYRILQGSTKDEISQFIAYLNNENLLRFSRIYREDEWRMYTLWTFNQLGREQNPLVIYKIINILLILLWLPTAIFAVVSFDFDYCDSMSGVVLGLVIGTLAHELGHFVAGRSSGAYIFELCLYLDGLLPGMCILMDENEQQSVISKVCNHGAGIGMNFVIAGLLMLLARQTVIWRGLLVSASLSNLLLAFSNLLPIWDSDGCKILRTFCRESTI